MEGLISLGGLLRELRKVCAQDCVVRELITSGHLSKWLARKPILERTGNYNLVALPNRYFDAVSIEERDGYFRAGRSLQVFSEEEKKEAIDILAREKPPN